MDRKRQSNQRLLAILSLSLILACNLGSPTATPEPSGPPAIGAATNTPPPDSDPTAPATAEPGTSTPETGGPETIYIPYENPAPRPENYLALIAQSVEFGVWTYEEGLLRVLGAYAGVEDAAAELASYPPPVEAGLHQLFIAVRKYTETGPDDAVREELARLMRTIAPDDDTLLAYSEPDDSQTAHPQTRLARPAAQTEAICQDLAEAGFPEDQATTCFLYSSFELDGKTFRVYYPASWGAGGGEKSAHVQAAFVALSDAVTRYAQFGAQNGVNLIFAIQPFPVPPGEDPNLGAVGADAGYGDPCPVAIYPTGAELNTADFKFVVAHEIFHCFQARHYEALMGVDGQDWWVEGTAEYFANLVYPGNDLEHRARLSGFVSQSRTVPVVEMGYESYLFFMYLGMRDDFGPAGVLALMGTMPVSGGAAEQAAALAGYPGMDQVWRDFGRAFIDNQILDTSGKLVQTDFIPTSTLGVLDTESFPLETRDFILARYLVALGPGQGFQVNVSQSDPDVEYDLRAKAAPGAWEAFSLDLPAGCAQYYGLLTSTGTQVGDGAGRESIVEAVVETPAVQGGTCDQCIVGNWELRNSSALAVFLDLMENQAGIPVIDAFFSGSANYEFTADGMLNFELSNLVIELTTFQQNEPFGNDFYTDMTLNMNGTDDALYWTDGAGGIYAFAADFSSIDYTMQVSLNGEQIYDGPALEGFPSAPTLQASNRYMCSESELAITISPETVNLGPLIYDRRP